MKADFEEKIVKRNSLWAYGFSTMMGIQCGFFARLTWWEYSWDVMEPVTYFATYAAVMGMYAYFVITSLVSICQSIYEAKTLCFCYWYNYAKNFSLAANNKEAIEID